MHRNRIPSRICTFAACCCALHAHAAQPTAQQADAAQGLWLTPGFYAYHFQRDKNLNDNAAGLGIEYRISAEDAFTAGVFHNSNWRTTHYLGYYWQPWAYGPMRLGVVAGILNGYPGMRQGGWFPALLPAAGAEYGRIGLNIYLVPTYKDRIAGSVSFQLKLKVF